MASRELTQVFTGLTDEPFFIEGRRKLRAPDGSQALKIVSVDEMRLERETDTARHLWSTVLDTEEFTLGIIDDGSFEDAMIRGVVGGSVLDEYPDTNYDQNGSYSSQDAYAQAFRLSAGAKISRVEFSMRTDAAPSGNVYARLYAAAGTLGSSAVPTGSPLAVSALVDVTTLPSAYEMIPFDFATPPDADADVTYCIAPEFDGTPDGLYPLVGLDVFAATHAGNMSQRNRSTGLWEAVASQDLIFRLTGTHLPWAAPSDRYRLVAECTVEYLTGGGQTEMDFRRSARVVASALNPVVS